MSELLNAIELALKNLNPTTKNVILTSEIGCANKNPNVKIINIGNEVDVPKIVKAVTKFKYIGIINSKNINQEDMTKLLNSLISNNNKTLVKLSENPLRCEIICPKPNIGDKYVEGNYEYSYGQGINYSGKWQAASGQNGWGTRVIDKTQTNYASPLSAIKGVPVTVISRLFHKNQMPTLNLIDWDTTNITNMSYLFEDSQATSITGLSNFATTNTTNMSGMFYNSKATSLDLSSFNTSKVSKMNNMFFGSETTCLDLSNFDTTNVITMVGMFFCCKAKMINGLDNFKTINVEDMSHMFAYSFVKSLDLSGFDTSNVTDMSRMFYNCLATQIIGLSKLNSSNVSDMREMFCNTKIRSSDLASFNITPKVSTP